MESSIYVAKGYLCPLIVVIQRSLKNGKITENTQESGSWKKGLGNLPRFALIEPFLELVQASMGSRQK